MSMLDDRDPNGKVVTGNEQDKRIQVDDYISLKDILTELKKINQYFEIITGERL